MLIGGSAAFLAHSQELGDAELLRYRLVEEACFAPVAGSLV